MKKLFSTLFIIVFSISGFSQSHASHVSPVQVEKMGSWSPIWDTVGYDATLLTARRHNESADQAALREYKALLNADKVAKASSLTHSLNGNTASKTTEAYNPSITEGFQTSNTQGTPSDNTLGISSDGTIVVAVNSLIRYYKTTGAARSGVIPLHDFFTNPSNGTLATNNLCDPKVLLDPRTDKFIIMAQTCSGTSSSSQVLLAFSKTSDPTDGWYYYVFTGNPSAVSGNNWFDYPKIGVNDHDLFVTGNLFSNSFNYRQSVIYQLDKSRGFAGGSYQSGDAIVHSSISGSPFTIVPSTVGRNLSMGNKMYFVSTNSFANNSTVLRFYELDGAVQSSPSLTRNDLYVSAYSQPADALQKGSSTLLSTGDFRGMDAIYVNGVIHFVAHIKGANDYTQIMYDRIYQNGGSWAVDEYNIAANNVDLSYPSVASMGWNNNDQAVGILMNFASPSYYPSVGAIFVSHEGEASDIIIVKEGTEPVSIIPDNGVTRWGDYTGMCPQYNASTPTVWGYGMFGSGSSSSWKNYVTNLVTNQGPQNVNLESKENQSLSVYPNPVMDAWNMSFETDKGGVFTANLYTMDGRLVRNLYSSELRRGQHSFAFNKGVLPAGVYLVTLTLDGTDIARKQITVTDSK